MNNQLKKCGPNVPLYDLLAQADLISYYNAMQSQLKVYQVEHLRYVNEADLLSIGMSRPELRRFFKVYHKNFPDSYIGKLRQKLKCKVSNSQDKSDAGSELSLGACSTSKTGQHIIPAESIVLCQQLGYGEFASVWQGVWSSTDRDIDKVQVAVKKVLAEKMHANPLDFLQEVAIMHRIDHENVVRFHGVVLNPKSVMLVTELAPLRSLAECLRQCDFRHTLTVSRLCEFAEQICAGMAHLESARLIHRDLAARNILVFSSSLVKVADFGLSRALGAGEEYYHSNVNANLKLPIAWCAPECIVYLKFTSASDVWSFGVTLWEMFTYGFQPWAGLTGQQILDCINVPRCRRLDMPNLCPVDYYNLMLQCWEHEPNNRPKFVTLLNLLPEVRPEQVRAIRLCNDRQPDHLQYKPDAVITVLNKRPREYPDGYYWKGALSVGRAGLFLPETTISLLNSEWPASVAGDNVSSAPSEMERSSQFVSSFRWPSSVSKMFAPIRVKPKDGKPAKVLISAPQNDLRHTGHVGSDGTYFGDVAFLQPPAAKDDLPKQVVVPYSCDTDEMRCQRQTFHEERASSINSETALLLNYEMPAACKSLGNEAVGLSSGSLLDEVFEALHQANLGFSEDEAADSASKTSHETTSPSCVCVENSSTERQQVNVKPMSNKESKMIDELTALANQLADKALRDQDEQLRSIVNANATKDDKAPCSPAVGVKLSESLRRLTKQRSHLDLADRPSFCSRLPPEGEVQLSTESEKAYKSMVEEGLVCAQPAAQKASDNCQPLEADSDPSLFDVRDDGSAVLRLMRSSTRLVPSSLAQKKVSNVLVHNAPPVPPRCKEAKRHSLEVAASDGDSTTPPPVPPKSAQAVGNVQMLRSRFENCRAYGKAVEEADGLMTQSVISSAGKLPLKMDNVDKYELLDFVLSSLPAEHRRPLKEV